jgi:hypothetical protein
MGYALQSVHRDIASDPAKWSLMARPAMTHDLALMRGTPAIEVVCHDTGCIGGSAVLDFEAGAGLVQLRVRDLDLERGFFAQSLPCNVTGDVIEIRGAFPAWSMNLKLVADAAAPVLPLLDVDGFSCLAFYSNNVGEDCQRLVALGARDATEEFEIELDGRNMSIVMLRSPGGAILELVKVNRR